MNRKLTILPPPVARSDEEPIDAGGRQIQTGALYGGAAGLGSILPAPVTLQAEESRVAGSRSPEQGPY